MSRECAGVRCDCPAEVGPYCVECADQLDVQERDAFDR